MFGLNRHSLTITVLVACLVSIGVLTDCQVRKISNRKKAPATATVKVNVDPDSLHWTPEERKERERQALAKQAEVQAKGAFFKPGGNKK